MKITEKKGKEKQSHVITVSVHKKWIKMKQGRTIEILHKFL